MELFQKYIKKYTLSFVVPILAMILCIIADNLSPYIQKILVDKAFKDGNTKLLFTLLTILFVVAITRSIAAYVKEYLFDIVSLKISRSIRQDLFKKIQSFEFSYFDGMNTGELMSRMSEDTDIIWQTISFGLRLFVESILCFGLSLTMMLFLDWQLGLACLVALLPIGFLNLRFHKKLSTNYDAISDQTAQINSTAQQNISGVRLVKSFAREKHEILKFLNINNVYYDLNVKLSKVTSTYLPLMDFLTNISLVVMIIFGGYLAIKGQITLGTLLAFSSYVLTLVNCSRMVGNVTSLLAQNKASSEKIFTILNKEPEILSESNSYSPDEIKGDIEFRNVSLKYNTEEEAVLKNINLNIPAGSTVAIMGTTGAGKSSLLSLIGRYYDPCEGEVLIDGVNVKNWDLNLLRSKMSIVFQDTFLFSDTIENNIKFSNGNLSKEELINVSQKACAYNFINSFEDGFDTLIGERGLGLSGGQKQRLSIARALARNGKILILDDATSALDMETEFTLLKNLNENDDVHPTTFIIGHRISAVKNADIILFMENGHVVEYGNHDELLAKKGYYYDIYCDQFKDFDMLESEVG